MDPLRKAILEAAREAAAARICQHRWYEPKQRAEELGLELTPEEMGQIESKMHWHRRRFEKLSADSETESDPEKQLLLQIKSLLCSARSRRIWYAPEVWTRKLRLFTNTSS